MVLPCLSLTQFLTFPKPSPPHNTRLTSGRSRFSQFVQCNAVNRPNSDLTIVRERPDKLALIGEDAYVQSLTSNYVGESYSRQADLLKEEVRVMIDKVEEPLNKLELIDTLQRLGISYHYEDEIKRILESIYNDNCRSDTWNGENLYVTALEFRLLRQRGYNVPQEVFNSFTDESGNFKACLSEDTKGMLYLYEASYLSTRSDSILHEARNFTTTHLKENLKKERDHNLAMLVSHALELPLHWRVLRMEARWFIDVYERRQDMNTTLLDFAKLDFNLVQATHQEDLKDLSRWWKNTCLGRKLNFARDNLMENFFWTVGGVFEPELHYSRSILTQLTALVTIIDDAYDAYGTLEDLEVFTDAVERWDINAIEQLPDNMKLCFLVLYNISNEMAYNILKEQDFYIISYLRNGWAGLCKAYLLEAKWYSNKYTPTFEEYINNAGVSIGCILGLVHGYFSVANPITNEALESLEKFPNIIQCSAMIVRLSNDLGPTDDDCDSPPKSIKCYMHETGGSEEDAREHIKYLISETWEKINEFLVADSPFDHKFTQMAVNLARMSLCMYQHGDGHGLEEADIKRLIALLINPIPICFDGYN